MAGFYASAGRIYIENTSNEVVFDTDEGLFVVTDRVTGTISTPARTASSASGGPYVKVNINTDHAITTVNSAADTVRGVFELSFAGAGGVEGYLGNLGAFNAGGTYIHYHGGIAAIADEGNPTFDPNTFAGQMLGFTFLASGGNLVLREQSICEAQPTAGIGTNTITFRAPTFDYDLFVGTFV